MDGNLPPANPSAGKAKIVDFHRALESIRGEAHGPTGQVTKPLITIPGLRVVMVSMRAGSTWKEHSTPGRVTVQPLAGRIRMHYSEGEFELGPGNLAVFAAAVPHDVSALADSVFLLTVARPAED